MSGLATPYPRSAAVIADETRPASPYAAPTSSLRHRPGTRGGFVHVPYEPGQLPPGSTDPSLPLEQLTEALAVVVRTTLATTADLKIAAGATH